MSRRPKAKANPPRQTPKIEKKRRRREWAEHAHAIKNRKGKELEKYLEERKAKRARMNLVAEQAAGALAKATQAFKREDLLATRKLQAKQRREMTRIEGQQASVANKQQAIAAIRSKIALDPIRKAAIDRYKARRKRIMKSVEEIDLEEDEAEPDDEWVADDDSSWMIDDDGIDEAAQAELDIIANTFRAEFGKGSAAVKKAARGLPPPPKIPESEFLTKPGAFSGYDSDEMDDYDSDEIPPSAKRRVALQQVQPGGEGPGLLPGGAGAGPGPAKRRVALQQVQQAEALVNPIFYVPEPAPLGDKEPLKENELRTLTPDDITELIVDVEGEINARGKKKHDVDGRWDLSGYTLKKLTSILKHVYCMQEMFFDGLISTEAAPQKATGIGAMFSRLFFS